MRECIILGCTNSVIARGWCRKHHQRWRRNGSPEKIKYIRIDGTPEERFWGKVDRTGDCWEWTAGRNPEGYGVFTLESKSILAHRYSYELHVGTIPKGLHIDHICREPCCVNPNHLRVATNKQNMENLGVNRNNTSGHRGVTWSKTIKRWVANVKHNGNHPYVSTHPLYELHIAGYKAMMKRNELFTHNELDRKR